MNAIDYDVCRFAFIKFKGEEMRFKSWFRVAVAAGGFALCSAAGAQSMFRCGSTYQDRPCDGATAGKRIGSTGSEQSAYQPVADAECAQRGADSIKIVWAREAGASADKQIGDLDAKGRSAKSEYLKKLIADVFNKRGSALEVRAAIESDCVQTKEKEAAWAAAGRSWGAPAGRSPPPSVPAPAQEVQAADGELRRGNEGIAQEDAETRKKNQCERLKARQAQGRSDMRAGGNAATMDRLNRKDHEIEGQLRQSGC